MSFLFDGLHVNQFNNYVSYNIKDEAILKIIFQDGSIQNMRFNININGEKLRILVMRHLGLIDNEYFGLMYETKQGSNKWAWLQKKKKIKKFLTKDSSVFTVKFGIRFYPLVPHLVAEWLGRRILFIDIVENIKKGYWYVENKNTSLELIALTCKVLDPVLIRDCSVDGIRRNSEKYGKLLMEKFDIMHCDILEIAMNFDHLLQKSNKRKRSGGVINSIQNINKDVLIAEYLKVVSKLQWYGSSICNINQNKSTKNNQYIYANYKGLSFVNSSQELLVSVQWNKIRKIERNVNAIKIYYIDNDNITKITFERNDYEVKNYFYVLMCLKNHVDVWNKKIKDDEIEFLQKLAQLNNNNTSGNKNNRRNISLRQSLGNSFRNSIRGRISVFRRHFSFNKKSSSSESINFVCV
ncbi:FERM domain and FERM, N-terminal domain and Band 4.1 domain-containing protein [Strongyloides ratti]|uniref:FERM domain and FERM, N-terminal domain and Band 4.1 domain-containing protein n=1 Tax=Strongyloides ratti TaxID=34506 RepID=A0A090KUI6_STRRB|nr:FERM domain and FERM, N-terminal domain and Band 4.1 domain-containing protein [Strongyloides ratti]CEF61081.1 FERM domain and FERM, N-terminal domain and Band 4.1 domain-containing protein [Strongyloides ratti]